jgi:hypothetical protein
MHWLPFAGGWTRHRDFPIPERETFQVQWVKQKKADAKAVAEADAEARRAAETATKENAEAAQ